MKKRGSMLVVIAIVTVVIALFVLLVLPQITKAYASGKLALKVAAARDIALILDAMYAYPYDTEINYDVDLSGFKVKISSNIVEISTIGAIDPLVARYNFVPVNDFDISEFTGPIRLVFKKENGKITVT